MKKKELQVQIESLQIRTTRMDRELCGLINAKFQSQINGMNEIISDMRDKLGEHEREIKTLKQQLDNPPKYNVGDKVGKWHIKYRVYFHKPTILLEGGYWYTCIHTKTFEEKAIHEDSLK